MTEQQHVPIEDLAAYAADDLDAAAAVTVEAHVVLCAECRSDVEAVKAATAALASLPAEPMPGAVAARLDAALAEEATPSRGPAGTVLPMQRRRRPSWSGVAAVAAGVAFVAGLTIPFVTGGDGDRKPASTAAREQTAAGGGTRRLASGLDYAPGNLAATLDRALAGIQGDSALGESFDGSSMRPPVTPTALSGRPLGEPLAPGFGAPDESTDTLRTDPARLAACVNEVSLGQPPAGRTPLVVDFATFTRREALILVFPSFTDDGEPRANRVDVFVVGGGCGVATGGDVLDFQRIVRPNL